MVVASLIGMAGGMLLGLHFRVFVLFPVQALALCAVCVLTATGGQSWPGPYLETMAGFIALQVGYLATAALGDPRQGAPQPGEPADP